MEIDAGQSVLGKRPHGGSSSGAGAGAKRPRGSKVPLPALTYYVGHSDPEIQASAKKLVENVPTYEGHLQQYIDAEDPDNGIEDEYHPKVLRMLPGMQLRCLFVYCSYVPPTPVPGWIQPTYSRPYLPSPNSTFNSIAAICCSCLVRFVLVYPFVYAFLSTTASTAGAHGVSWR